MNAAMTYSTTGRRNNPAVFLFIALILIGAAAVLAAPNFLNATPKTVVPPEVKQGVHADIAHGAEAEQTRNTCRQYGIQQVWQEKGNGYYHFLCQSPELGWMDWIVNEVNGKWEEATAFRPKTGKLSDIIQWLKRKPLGVKWIDLDTFEIAFR